MATKITGMWRQGRHVFTPGQKIKFGDPDGDMFMQSVGCGETIPDADADFELSQEECDFDPVTVFPDGSPVLENPTKPTPTSDQPVADAGVLQPKDVVVVAGADGGPTNG